MSKLRGSRLEAEVERSRAECRWARVSELLPSIKARNSGLETLYGFLYGEWKLEKYLEELGAFPSPEPSHKEPLKEAVLHLRGVLEGAGTEGGGGGRWPQVTLEARLLLAKAAYLSGDLEGALNWVGKARLEGNHIQFQTLRTLRLVAEAYAIKGLALEAGLVEGGGGRGSSSRYQRALKEDAILAAFEKASDLALSYIAELEKAVTGGGGGGEGGGAQNWAGVEQRIGLVLETALQRVPLMYIESRSGTEAEAQAGVKQAHLARGVEQYRKVLMVTDKPVARALHQRLCRQLAEVLVRGVSQSLYAPPAQSKTAKQKRHELRIFLGGGTQVLCPESRLEELLLLLSISESIAANEAVLSRADEDASERKASHEDVKAVQNLLSLVLAGLHHFQLLSSILEKALKFAFEDAFVWIQFGLCLTAAKRHVRAGAVFDRALATLEAEEEGGGEEKKKDPLPHLFAASLALEQLREPSEALRAAQRARELSEGGILAGRAQLLLGLASAAVAARESQLSRRKAATAAAIAELEEAVRLDPDDALAHFHLALTLASARDTPAAREHCLKALEICPDLPSGYILLGLLLTAQGEMRDAREVVEEALLEYPTSYGLLVLRLKLQVQAGEVEEALGTGKELLLFWKLGSGGGGGMGDMEVEACGGGERAALAKRSLSPGGAEEGGDSVMNQSSLLLPSATLPRSGSALEMGERESVMGGGALSELGGAASTVSESLGVSSERRLAMEQFRCQANIWVELAEMYLGAGRLVEVRSCVEEATAAFPASHQSLYLRGRLRTVEAGSEAAAEKRSALLEEAKASFLGALAILPSHQPSLRHLASAYAEGENLGMAEGILSEVVKAEPFSAESWAELAGVLARAAGRSEDAAEAYATALALSQTSPLLPYSIIPSILHLHP